MLKLEKRKKICRGLIFIILLVLTLSGISRLKIETVEEHKNTEISGEIPVTIKISCETILNKEIKDKEHFKEDGIILDFTEYKVSENTTVFDVLKMAVSDKEIQMEYTGGRSAYIEGIYYLYEFDYGELSGWMYKVNGQFPGVGCNEYKVKEDDIIEFVYTCDLGRDVGNEYQE